MPVSEKEWENGKNRRSFREILMRVLESEPSNAYNITELTDKFATYNTHSGNGTLYYLTQTRTLVALDGLITQGKVEVRFIPEVDEAGNQTKTAYYRAK